MSIKLSFGMYDGKSLEWLFFHAPWYVTFIRRKGMQHQRHLFSEEEEDVFEELCTRASCLAGSCKYCNIRPFTYMGLSTHVSGALGHIGFFCDECEYTGGSQTGYYEPSFFMPYHTSRTEQLMLTTNIKSRYIGTERLTQEKMEEFFHNDANFVHATPGFFRKEEVTA